MRDVIIMAAPNGEIADSSSALVASLVKALVEHDCRPASSASASQMLGLRKA
ncbi:MAG: 3-keto-5-aminohexanoate cleavage protein [Gammaproteobacteria bacterium]|nr:3-keto-5-aminohexanoate cleavage protein [Gammaproteobacteria bacterium]